MSKFEGISEIYTKRYVKISRNNERSNALLMYQLGEEMQITLDKTSQMFGLIGSQRAAAVYLTLAVVASAKAAQKAWPLSQTSYEHFRSRTSGWPPATRSPPSRTTRSGRRRRKRRSRASSTPTRQ